MERHTFRHVLEEGDEPLRHRHLTAVRMVRPLSLLRLRLLRIAHVQTIVVQQNRTATVSIS